MSVRVRHALERWAYSEYRASTRDLACFRVLLAGFIALRLPQGREIATLPKAFFDPPLSLAALGDDFAGAGTFLALNLISAGALLMLLLGYRTVLASFATSASLLLLQSATVATGKIDHTILLLSCPAILATSGWGGLWSIDALAGRGDPHPDRVRGRWPLAWLALTVTLAMSTAGLAKLYSGWLRLDVSAAYGQAVANAWLSDRHTLLGDLLLQPSLAGAWEPLDWATVVIELFAPVVIVRAAWLRAWCMAACVFHLGIGLTMDIWFSTNVVVYSAFLPWRRVAPPARPLPGRAIAAMALACALMMLAASAASPTEGPLLRLRESLSRLVVLSALPLAVYARSRRRRSPAGTAAVRVA